MSLIVDWQAIDTVLLDMDGTLLDLHFDNHFWRTHLPRRYGEAKGLSFEQAREELMARYHARAGTLEWYSVDFWQTELELDIMRLKDEVAHLIAVHPAVPEFLAALHQAGKTLVLATNAHHKSLTLKMARTHLEPHFDALISSHALGAPKEECAFWERLKEIVPFDPARTLLIDDSLSVLTAAQRFGIAHLIAVRRPDSRAEVVETGSFAAIDGFAQLLSV